MGNLVSIDRIAKRAGDQELFAGLSFGLQEGDRIGFIGRNGAGKSTLLRLIAGLDEPDEGRIVRRRGLRTSFLRQQPEFEPDDRIRDHVYRGDSPTVRLLRDYEAVCRRVAEAETDGAGNPQAKAAAEAAHAELDRLTGELRQRGAWDYESEVRDILGRLGVTDLDQPMSQLSGGMLKKTELARTLIDDADLLLLDEPTNHLDVETILWLESHLAQTPRAFFLVTHDRYFLDRVCNRIVELDRGMLHQHEGGYTSYLEARAAREEAEAKSEAKARNFLRKEREWLQRQPKARGTKQKARIDRISEVENRRRPEEGRELEFSVTGRRLGKKILEAKDVGKRYGERPILKGFTRYFQGGERLGVVGPNGAGKSTLLNLLAGRIQPDEGEIVHGANTRVGYFDQTGAELPLDQRVIEFIKSSAGERIAAGESVLDAGRLLETFLFDDRLQYAPIRRLSGGERRRLQLVEVLIDNPNFLILDEPTNDLDIATLSVLENFLQEYAGCVVVVSHDRYFMDRVVDELLIVDGKNPEIQSYPGVYSRYLEEARPQTNADAPPDQAQTASGAATKDAAAGIAIKKRKKKPSQKEKREFDALEREIAELEAEQARLESVLSGQAEAGPEGHAGAGLRHTELGAQLEAKLERWAELAELAESAE